MKVSVKDYPMKDIIQISAELDQKILQVGVDEGKPKEIEDKIEETHVKLKELVAKYKLKFFLVGQIQGMNAEINEVLEKLQKQLNNLPNTADQLKATLDEMTVDTMPDKNADYWEEKQNIQEKLSRLAIITSNLKSQKLYF